MTKQLHIKNHYVPECYLKRWESSEGKVFVYRTLVNHPNVPIWKSHFVSSIAYQKHLYTQIISGHESDELEMWLDREFESPANEVLDKAALESQLNTLDWEVLIKFLSAQDVRTPARLYEYIQRAQKYLPGTLQNVMNDLHVKLSNGDVSELTREGESSVRESFPLKVTTHIEEGSDTGFLKAETYTGRGTWIHSIKHLLENTSKILHTHKWSIVKPALGYFWPTSDNPVVKLNYYSPGKYDLKGGWGVKKGNIFFPIDPEHAMFVQIGDKPMKKNTRLSENQTKEFIKFVVENSHRKIFSHSEASSLPRLRERIVDPDRLTRENNEMKEWHRLNAKMEREYSASRRNT